MHSTVTRTSLPAAAAFSATSRRSVCDTNSASVSFTVAHISKLRLLVLEGCGRPREEPEPFLASLLKFWIAATRKDRPPLNLNDTTFVGVLFEAMQWACILQT